MGTNYFRFKQFTINQDRCGMKVGTDGVLLGAWSGIRLKEIRKGAIDILDVGSGTGLLSLMLAQALPKARIIALEIDSQASEQSKENIMNSDFHDRIENMNLSFQEFSEEQCSKEQKYDAIISNPPFFNNSLQAPEQKRNIARHDKFLSLKDFIDCTLPLLNSEEGRLCIILPSDRYDEFEKLSDQKLSLTHRTNVYTTTKSSLPKRVLLEYRIYQKRSSSTIDSLYIEEGRHEYTEQFKTLLKDYYLKF